MLVIMSFLILKEKQKNLKINQIRGQGYQHRPCMYTLLCVHTWYM